MAKVFNRPVVIAGERRTIDGVQFKIIEYDSQGNIARATCESTPTGVGVRGFAKMAEVKDRQNKKYYKNSGSEATSTFTEFTKGDAGSTGATGATGATGPVDVETVTLEFGATAEERSIAITTGSKPIGFVVSDMSATAPNPSHLELQATGATLTGKLSAQPGADTSLAFEVTLRKA